MNMQAVMNYGWVPCADDRDRGLWEHKEYRGIKLVPSQILAFHTSEEYRNNILGARNVMDVFFNQIFKELP